MNLKFKLFTLFVLLALVFGAMGVSSAEAASAPVTTVAAPLNSLAGAAPNSRGPQASSETAINLKVNQTGMYRVTYEMLRGAGLDLKYVNSSRIALYNAGQEIPIYMKSKGKFGPGDYFEFYGQALDTIYTDTNVYALTVIGMRAARIPEANVRAQSGSASPDFYLEKTTMNRQRAYADYAPGADPWYDTELTTTAGLVSRDFTFQVDNLAAGSAASMELTVWGVTDWPASPDHHLLVSVNGTQAADVWFDGLVEEKLTINLPAGMLREGDNTLQLTLAGDTGQPGDVVDLDGYTVTYERAFQARDGRLAFTAAGRAFTVKNLPGADVAVYSLTVNGVTRQGGMTVVQEGGAYSVTFAGDTAEAAYLVATGSAMLAPVFETVRPYADLNQAAQYLVISHPQFIPGLSPLVEARRAQGLTVSVVDVNDVYAQFSYGVFDPQAIRDYIAYAKQYLGVQYILLVGGDTYDYRNYLGVNSVSFIPSLYFSTGLTSRFVPADPLYADVNYDNVPDLAIGRFPVRTIADLDMLINKTLAYGAKDYARTAVFVSDYADGVSFRRTSDKIAATLPADWSVSSYHLDYLGVSTSRVQLLDAMNRGASLVTFTGHINPTMWTNSSLFTTSAAAGLTNAGRPFVAVQWGCSGNYYLHPSKTYLAQALLFSGDRGAAATLGATALLHTNSIARLSVLVTPRLATPGMTVGQAVQDAKAELALGHPELLEVLLGWTLLGDPALVVAP